MPFVLLNKPFRVLSQFTDRDGRATLADYVSLPGVYACGRLDFDSEGLLLLTDDGGLQAAVSDPAGKIVKTYAAQVEGEPSADALAALEAGVTLRDGPAAAAFARRIDAPEWLWPRDPPIRFRRRVADAWLEIGLTEGRNRQVRRMTAAVGLPTLRLVRTAIGPFAVEGLAPGALRVVANRSARRRLAAHLKNSPAA